ncbi:MAG: carbon storage regulator [Planctomycetia bacterium]|nr:carbon storage regulator [Planctomycetia bacterium]
MLVLTRKKDESIIINDNIVITVTDIRGGKIRLGIHAPENVSVVRREILGRKTVPRSKERMLVGTYHGD